MSSQQVPPVHSQTHPIAHEASGILIFVDILTALCAVAGIVFFREYALDLGFSQKIGAIFKTEAIVFYSIAACSVSLLFRLNNLYKYRVLAQWSAQAAQIIKSFLTLALVMIILLFFFQGEDFTVSARGTLLGFILLGILLFFVERAVIVILMRKNIIFAGRIEAKRVLIIGAGRTGETLGLSILNDPALGIEHAWFIDDDEEKIGTTVLGFPVLGPIANILNHAINTAADEIYVAINTASHDRLLTIIEACKATKLPLKVMSRRFQMIQDTSVALDIGSQVTIRPAMIAKRIIDLSITLCAVLLLLIPAVLVALAVILTSRGPIFYASYRVGKGGKLFKMFKFRTMYLNDESEHRIAAQARLQAGQHMGKVVDDPRITPIGKILRKYSIDELPQLLNVLRGDMSLIGPRPCLEYELQYFEEWHKRRFLVLPGLTGLWQVTGRQIEGLNLHDAMILDVYYAENFTLWLDIQILFKTIPVVLFARGSK